MTLHELRTIVESAIPVWVLLAFVATVIVGVAVSAWHRRDGRQ